MSKSEKKQRNGASVIIPMSDDGPLPPPDDNDFERLADELETELGDISSTVKLADAGDSGALAGVDARLRAVRKRIDVLRQIIAKNQQDKGNKAIGGMARVRATRLAALGSSLRKIVGEAESVAKKMIDANNIAYNGSKIDIDSPGLEQLPQQQQQLDRKLGDKRAGLELIQTRNRELKGLVKGLEELHDLFGDLAIVVDGQQDVLNEVEANIDDTKEVARKADAELVNVDNYRRAARRKKMWISAIIISIILVIVLILLFVLLR